MAAMRVAIVVVCLLAGAVAPFVPIAVSQPVPHFGVSVQATPLLHEAPVAPPGGAAEVLFYVEAFCYYEFGPAPHGQSLLHPTNLAAPTFHVFFDAQIDAAAGHITPSGGQLVFAFHPEDCLYFEMQGQYLILSWFVAEDAPAYFHPTLELTFLNDNDIVGHAYHQAMVDFAGDFQADVPEILVDVPQGAQVKLPVLVQNDANGAVALRYGDLDTTLTDTSIVAPAETVVGSLQSGAVTHQAAMPLTVESYAPVGAIGVLSATLEGRSADDDERLLEPQTVRVVLRIVDPLPLPPEEAPAPNMVLPSLVVFALAAFLRRRISA